MTLSKTVLAAITLILLSTSPPAAAHDFWINHSGYKAPTGEHCCGNNDCFSFSADEVKITPSGYSLPSGEVVPFSEAQQSEDGEFWRCKRYDGSRRCFFAPQQGS